MFNKKQKVTAKAELEAQREARINETIKKLRIQILTMETKKNELFKKIVEARQNNLQSQEDQARGIMRKCMAIQHQAKGMLMTLELAIQSKDLAEISKRFLECIGLISEDIEFATEKVKNKGVEKKYLKAMYESNNYVEQIDHMFELGDYVSIAASENESYMEYNKEIDAMLARIDSGVI